MGVAGQSERVRAHGLVGHVAHAEGFASRLGRFVPRPYRVVIEGESHRLPLGPGEGLHQAGIGGFKGQLGFRSVGGRLDLAGAGNHRPDDAVSGVRLLRPNSRSQKQ